MQSEAEPAVLVRGRLAEAGAAASGVLYFLAFAGFDQWWLTFVALVPLWLALQGQTTKRATWLGFLTGLMMNLGGFYWLTGMLKTFSGFPLPLCLLFVIIICSYQAGRIALMGWLYGRAANRGWPTHLVFAAAFAASELTFPLLFPWYYAATVHQIPILMQLAEIGGPILVGLVLVSANLAIAEPIRAHLLARQGRMTTEVSLATGHERRGPMRPSARVMGIGVLVMLFALLFGAVRIRMTKARMQAAEPVRVGLVQANMELLAKREDPNEGLRRHLRLTADLKRQGVDFVVWSESSVMRPVWEDLAPVEFRSRFASSLGKPAIFGAVLRGHNPNRPNGYGLYNSAISTDLRGNMNGRYDKQFLLAFGEYLPFGDTFPILYEWSPNSGNFTKGTSLDPVIIDMKGQAHKVSVLICYEDILPAFTNRMVSHANPELLVNITNDAWFGNTKEPWEHLALAKFRAIEHRRYLVRSTNSGVSAIVDPVGSLVTTSKVFVEEAQASEIHWLQGRTAYEIVGDVPWYLVAFGIVIASFRRRSEAAVANA
ncbi:MAG: apolipoprotein N-acyltransferase [Polyangiaceae bacterium]|nr:apolipoprotein N-acyltransferase [Polyangiaceae bacterium]